MLVWAVVAMVTVLGAGSAGAQQDPAEVGEAEVMVVGSGGVPVGSAGVSLIGTNGERVTVTTDDRGLARFEGLAPGSYEVEVRVGGELVSRGTAEVTANATALLRSVVVSSSDSDRTTTKGVPSWVLPLLVVMGVILALALPWVFTRLAARRRRQADELVDDWSASLPPPPEEIEFPPRGG